MVDSSSCKDIKARILSLEKRLYNVNNDLDKAIKQSPAWREKDQICKAPGVWGRSHRCATVARFVEDVPFGAAGLMFAQPVHEYIIGYTL